MDKRDELEYKFRKMLMEQYCKGLIHGSLLSALIFFAMLLILIAGTKILN